MRLHNLSYLQILKRMKKVFLSIFLATGGLLAQTAKAQVGVSVGMQIGPLVINVHKPVMPPPQPVIYDDFYYLPDVEAYYSVPEHCYYYMDEDDRWISGQYLPGRYHDYDWRRARRYEVRAQRPYANHEFYRNKFGGNRGGNWGYGEQYANRGGYDRRGGYDVYRQPQRNDDRFDNRGGYGGRRLPSSPFDSNNAGGGRGGNYDRQMPQDRNNGGWNNDRQNDNNGWNGNRRNDNNNGWNGNRRNDDNNGWNGNRQNDDNADRGRNRNYGPDRSQGGIFNNGGDNRGNDGGQYNRGNRPQGEYSRPSNNDGQGQNNYPNGGGDRGNRGGDGQQRGGNGGGRQQMASVPRMGF